MDIYSETGVPGDMANLGSSAGDLLTTTTATETPGLLSTTAPSTFSKALSLGGKAYGTVAPVIAGVGMGNLIEASNFGNYMHKQTGMSKQGAKVMGGIGAGAAAGAATGAAWGSFIPGPGNIIGGLLGGLFGGISASTKKCIIIETCFGSDSDETKLAREYKNKFFTKEILRGYHMFSEPIVNLMEQYPEVKEYYRKSLAEPLLRVARWKLGYTKEHPTITDCAIAANHTSLWHDLGASIKSFQRSNGEVV
jgi:hypothetical protein